MRSILTAVTGTLFFLGAIVASAQSDFGIGPGSPEVPRFSAADILYSDSSQIRVVVSAATLGLQIQDDVDAFSYGIDEIEPLGPNFYVTILYSVNGRTAGLQGTTAAGTGAVWLQARGNGAAGDMFYLKARQVRGLRMVPISRGLRSDAPMHKLMPKNPGPQSELDGLSFRVASVPRTVYFSVNRQHRRWRPADILRVNIDPATGIATGPPRVWATAEQLGLRADDNIDAVAIRNPGDDDLNRDDVIYVSVDKPSPGRSFSNPPGSESVLQVFPLGLGASPRVVFTASLLNLTNANTEELDGLTGVDPGPNGKPQTQQMKSKPGG